MPAARIHNTASTTLELAGQDVPAGGYVDVDDLDALGELPAGAYVRPVAQDLPAPVATDAASTIARIRQLDTVDAVLEARIEEQTGRNRSTVLDAAEARLLELEPNPPADTTGPTEEHPAP